MKTSAQQFLSAIIVAVMALLGTACQQPYYGSGNVGVKDHSDAVVHINQVDPAYRGYFADQHDSNYSLQDQRKAFFEAVKTSKTPVQQDAKHMRAAKPKKKAARKTASRSSKKKVVKRKSTSKSKAKPKKKTTRRKKR
ncbi:MAG: hypothetical protein IJB64_10985 [Akkermansia sp.]|nr:hypothetical protein [Akkermansia sp.]MBQ9094904.1 hypothetical protein [Akkermansia sp.]